MRSHGPLVPSQPRLPRVDRGALIAIPLLFAAVLWAPILRNYFFGDDLMNLYWIVNGGFIEYLIKPSGGHILATRNAVYALCFWLFGTDPRWYFLLALLTHLLNVALLFGVIRVLTRSPRLACLGATLWGTAPLNEGALGWYSVYGQVLAATIFLWLFYRLSRIGAGEPPPRQAVPWGWVVLLLAASTCFGVGIAVTLVFPLVALLLLPPTPARTRSVAVLAALALFVIALYVALHRVAAYLYPNLWAFKWSPFDNLRQPGRIAVLTLHLMGFGLSNLLLGPFAFWAPYGGDAASVVIALFAIAVTCVLVAARAPVRRRLLACLVVSVACYGIIAAGRAWVLNRAPPNLVVQATRYHYLAPLPFAVVLCLMLSQTRGWWPLGRAARDAILAAFLAATAVGSATAGRRIEDHSLARQVTEATVAAIQRRIDAAPPGADVYIDNRAFGGVGALLINNPKVFPGWAAVFTVFFPDNTVDGRRVFFVVEDPAVRGAAAAGKRTANLLVPPSATPEEPVR